jgi:penicillin-binding protein 1C
MYAALADDGSAAPLRLLAGPRPDHVPFLQPAAARSVAAVLTRPFPDGGPPGVAWKTGTSWGGRDAWAIGFDRRHVVGVWIGRPDGTPLPGATGLRLAMPMLARVFGLLPAAPRHARLPAPPRAALSVASTESLRLLFPPPGAVLALEGPVTIRVMGGQRPITFLVDGHPIPAAAVRRETSWTPAGPGFYRLTVLDADGLATHATVRVRDAGGDQVP